MSSRGSDIPAAPPGPPSGSRGTAAAAAPSVPPALGEPTGRRFCAGEPGGAAAGAADGSPLSAMAPAPSRAAPGTAAAPAAAARGRRAAAATTGEGAERQPGLPGAVVPPRGPGHGRAPSSAGKGAGKCSSAAGEAAAALSPAAGPAGAARWCLGSLLCRLSRFDYGRAWAEGSQRLRHFCGRDCQGLEPDRARSLFHVPVSIPAAQHCCNSVECSPAHTAALDSTSRKYSQFCSVIAK